MLSDERNETRAVTERRRKQGGRLRPDPGELSERKAAIVTNVRRKGAALLSHRSPPPFVTRSVRRVTGVGGGWWRTGRGTEWEK